MLVKVESHKYSYFQELIWFYYWQEAFTLANCRAALIFKCLEDL